MKSQTVKTREELQKAQKNRVEQIIVKGELANKLNKAKAITKLSVVGLGVLTAALGAGVALAPATGGASVYVSHFIGTSAATAVSASTGLGTAAIVSASALGIALIIAVYKEYEEIEFSNGKMVLRRKKRPPKVGQNEPCPCGSGKKFKQCCGRRTMPH